MYIERFNMTTGIYLISFPNTQKVYIGQSLNIPNRFRDHLNDMRNNREPKKLQEAYNTYGYPTCEILETTSIKDLNTKENYHIALWNSVIDGFNTLETANTMPILYGESNPASLYTNDQIFDVISLLIDFPHENFKYIEILTGVSRQVISNIFNGTAHIWVKAVDPVLYDRLEYIRNFGRLPTYTTNEGINTDKLPLIEEAFFYVVDNPELSLKDISSITGLSRAIVYSISIGKTYKFLASKYPDKYTQLLNSSNKREYLSNVQKFASKGYPSLINKDGRIEKVDTLTNFAKKYNLDLGALSKLLSGKIAYHKGWWVYLP